MLLGTPQAALFFASHVMFRNIICKCPNIMLNDCQAVSAQCVIILKMRLKVLPRQYLNQRKIYFHLLHCHHCCY